MLSLRELRRVARVLDQRMTGHRIERIVHKTFVIYCITTWILFENYNSG